MNSTRNEQIKVIIVDDSALIRALLREILEGDSRIKVVATAIDPYEAREKIKEHNPDVMTLDVEMPKMNGIQFLKNVMRLRPMPVVMISTLTQEGAPTTLEALELGAVDFFPKPMNTNASALSSYRTEICEKVCMAARANVKAATRDIQTDKPPVNYPSGRGDGNFLCAIGASTGGTEAIKHVLSNMPKNAPATVIAQHIPSAFSGSFARRVDSVSAIRVYEAEHEQPIVMGSAYIAPGHSHLRVARSGSGYVCKLDSGTPVNRHMPSVDVLFDSVTTQARGSCMGVLLTGMGADGAEGLLRMRQAGSKTVVQDENSSVVWGMPGAAFALGAAMDVLDLNKIANHICCQYFR